ncbi:MAG: gas vesicle synthesis GvpLGvpF [Nitrospirae bacterium CG_4_10_14_0_8_um_filter_41_23]|nr:MAG: gas vesicle synthesis GvpLGvpF [Nitrospirae bacterium CG11_big_fil_rev_8_21_14_0_20_41_14]PIV44672.1 MAG: gas vesicle synthesis GvpLGvpF [Nitrospirae bacterium CG02_land_8_20_14_3_00_41_53]PIW86383.1 MAG: gas vesicle synthesis GvpLGvpF [Nitrospirae bacterium CG_4_8_14_3_um_filter_41_47]PIY87839.1 MAG: gas vesicle synthesis GvpLGvpF [Nitrospirae bacterium CG_4_10_14_0_8_um_filter_41_23]PJA81192.1 MAG: gas vesicle synthesis GvpLGvpF [Nitrospirae bacterium CG_4_9_14_3_um_filter_41_27]
MEKEGKYIYCIIGTSQERNFGPIGIGGKGDEVLTIGYDDLSMVVSSHPMTKFVVNRENMLAHEKVIEEVMKEFDSVLPVRFGTVASGADEIRNLLDRRCREFKDLLRDMDHKIELSVKGIWKNMDIIFKEIVKENKEIKKARDKISNLKSQISNLKTEVGKMVEQALAKKKEKEAEKIVDILRRTAIEYKLNKTIGDEMFMNGVFLVDKGKEKEFDNIMDDLGNKCRDRIKFMYTGPFPVFNFVNIVIYPEEWER